MQLTTGQEVTITTDYTVQGDGNIIAMRCATDSRVEPPWGVGARAAAVRCGRPWAKPLLKALLHAPPPQSCSSSQLQEAGCGPQARVADPVRRRLHRHGGHQHRPGGRHRARALPQHGHARVSAAAREGVNRGARRRPGWRRAERGGAAVPEAAEAGGRHSQMRPGQRLLAGGQGGAAALPPWLSSSTSHVCCSGTRPCSLCSERKNVNLPGVVVDLPTLTEKDVDDITNWAVPNDIDFIAASFVRKGSDIDTIRQVRSSSSSSCTWLPRQRLLHGGTAPPQQQRAVHASDACGCAGRGCVATGPCFAGV